MLKKNEIKFPRNVLLETSVNSNTQGTRDKGSVLFELTNVRIIGIKTLLNQVQETWEFVRNNEEFELSGIRNNGFLLYNEFNLFQLQNKKTCEFLLYLNGSLFILFYRVVISVFQRKE